MSTIPLSCRIESLQSYYDFHATVDVLRLDLLHPVISGNKWFKLKEYITEAKKAEKILLTFGGPYSNHIVATAAAANNEGLKSVGIIRGDETRTLSTTLVRAKEYGMQLFYTSREAYKNKLIPSAVYDKYPPHELYVIPEGGYGALGVAGAAAILRENDTHSYSHFLVATGTGTTLAGIVSACGMQQQVIGVSVLKGNFSLQNEVASLLPQAKENSYGLLHEYHFGGYAKHNNELLTFMNNFYERTGIPTDFVYTGKAFYAAFDLLSKNKFSATDRILLIHTGGLQGNASLPKGTLIFK